MISKLEDDELDLSKQEIISNGAGKSTSSWSRLKDPRIVRVSRAFGGKDRHSKVCTVKGLRDRRVRLSVPTAIQLYDLQDRLGLNQPSKVVDWLLHAAKTEIDELPPLVFPPDQTYNHFPINVVDPKHALICKNELGKSKAEDHADVDDHHEHSLFAVSNHQDSCYGSSVPYNLFARWDPNNSNLALSHHQQRSQQHDEWTNFNLMGPSASLHLHHHQQQQQQDQEVLHHVYQQQQQHTQCYFPDSGGEINNTNSSPPAVRQIHFNMMTTANLLPSQNDDAS